MTFPLGFQTTRLTCEEHALSAFPTRCHVVSTANASWTYSLALTSLGARRHYGCPGDKNAEETEWCAGESVKEIHCQLDCADRTELECAAELGSPLPEENYFSTPFLLFFVVHLASTLAVSTVMPLVDAITLELVEKDQTKYGLQRVSVVFKEK